MFKRRTTEGWNSTHTQQHEEQDEEDGDGVRTCTHTHAHELDRVYLRLVHNSFLCAWLVQVFRGAVTLSGGGAETAVSAVELQRREHSHQWRETHTAARQPAAAQRHGGTPQRVCTGSETCQTTGHTHHRHYNHLVTSMSFQKDEHSKSTTDDILKYSSQFLKWIRVVLRRERVLFKMHV